MAPGLHVTNRTRNTVLVARGRVANDLWSRFVGLMGRRVFEYGDGLLLRGEKAIHSFGMLIPIDVLYLDRNARIIRLDASMSPWRLGPLVRGVQDVLELPSGTLAVTQTQVGDELALELTL